MSENPKFQLYQSMLKNIARQYSNILQHNSSYDFQDLVAETSLSFVRALKSFKPALGARFSTHLRVTTENDLRMLYGAFTREKRAFPGRVKGELEDALLFGLESDEPYRLPPISKTWENNPEDWATLTEDQKEAVRIINEYPDNLVSFLKGKPLTKARFTEYLKKVLKWKPTRIDGIFAEDK